MYNINLIDLNKVWKDQIYFVDKDEIGNSILYFLYDFKDFRENMDVEKGYFQGRFDVILYLSDLFFLIIEFENGQIKKNQRELYNEFYIFCFL